MKNSKRLAIVGTLALGVILSSLSVTGQGLIPLPSTALWNKLCKEQAEWPDACTVAVRALETAVKDELGDPAKADFTKGILPELKKALHLKGKASCTECLNEANSFLSLLNDNSTLQDIEQLGQLSCDEKFVDPDLADECSEFIDTYIPQVIQLIDTELPPAQLCVELKHCPAP